MIAAPPKRETPGGEPGASQDKTVKSNSGELPAIRLGSRLRIPLKAIEEIENSGRIIRSNPKTGKAL